MKLPLIILSQIQDAQIKIESEFKENLTNTKRGVIKLNKAQIHPIYDKARFKLPLTQLLKLNKKNINPLLKEKSISRVLKQHIQMIEEVPVDAGGYFDLAELKHYFNSKGVDEKLTLRTTMLAYNFKIIEAHIIEDKI